MGKKEIKSSIIELEDEKTKLQTDIDELMAKIKNYKGDKDNFDINNATYLLWIKQLGKYTDRMTGLENTLNNLYELLKQPHVQSISNGMFFISMMNNVFSAESTFSNVKNIKKRKLHDEDHYFSWDDSASINLFVEGFIETCNLVTAKDIKFPKVAPENSAFDIYFDDDFELEALELVTKLCLGKNPASQERRPIGALSGKSGMGKSTCLDFLTNFIFSLNDKSSIEKLIKKCQSVNSLDFLLKKSFFPIPITFNKNTLYNIETTDEPNVSFEIAVRILYFAVFTSSLTATTFVDFYNEAKIVDSLSKLRLTPVRALAYLQYKLKLMNLKFDHFFLLADEIALLPSYRATTICIGSLIDNDTINCSAVISSLNYLNTYLSYTLVDSKREVLWLKLRGLDYWKLKINDVLITDLIALDYCNEQLKKENVFGMLSSLGGHGRLLATFMLFLDENSNVLKASVANISRSKLRELFWTRFKGLIYDKFLINLTIEVLEPVLLCKEISCMTLLRPELYLNTISNSSERIIPTLSSFLLYCFGVYHSNSSESGFAIIGKLLVEILNFDVEVISGASYELLFSQILNLRRLLLTRISSVNISFRDYIGTDFEIGLNGNLETWNRKIFLHQLKDYSILKSDHFGMITKYNQPLTLIGNNNPGFDSFEVVQTDSSNPTKLILLYEFKSKLPGTEKTSYISENDVISKCNYVALKFKDNKEFLPLLVFMTLKNVSNFNKKVPLGCDAVFVDFEQFKTILKPFLDNTAFRSLENSYL